MTETKKQHFVPRTYLRNFAHLRNDDFYVNVLQKNQPCEKIFESNITNICAENHLYTLTGDTESRQLLENIYSNIFENEYKDLFSVLTNDTIYEITGEMKKSIVSALITMFYRTKKWVNEYNSFNDESMNKVYQVCKQFNVDSFTNPNGEQINIKDKSLGELQSNLKKSTRIPIVLSQLKVALRLIDAKQFDNINVFKIIDNCEFITSDNPVLAMNVNKMPTIPFDIDNAYYLPISAKYLLSIFPKEDLPANNKIIRMIMSKEKVLGFNKWQLENSDKFIIGSRKSLIETKEN
jgi:flagellar biosynthesis/type III secretory pathway chaperone